MAWRNIRVLPISASDIPSVIRYTRHLWEAETIMSTQCGGPPRDQTPPPKMPPAERTSSRGRPGPSGATPAGRLKRCCIRHTSGEGGSGDDVSLGAAGGSYPACPYDHSAQNHVQTGVREGISSVPWASARWLEGRRHYLVVACFNLCSLSVRPVSTSSLSIPGERLR